MSGVLRRRQQKLIVAVHLISHGPRYPVEVSACGRHTADTYVVSKQEDVSLSRGCQSGS